MPSMEMEEAEPEKGLELLLDRRVPRAQRVPRTRREVPRARKRRQRKVGDEAVHFEMRRLMLAGFLQVMLRIVPALVPLP